MQQQLENDRDRVEKLQRAMEEQLYKTEVSVVHFYADGHLEFCDFGLTILIFKTFKPLPQSLN